MKRILPVLLVAVMMLAAVTAVSAAKVQYGDVTGDGDINNRDLALLQQHINGWDVTADLTAADVNNDGDVNNRDLALLQQYINGWDVTLGPDVEEPDTPVDPDPDTPIEPDIPVVALPEVGYDLDGRGRILVESVQQEGNVVTVVIANTNSKWITEETSYVKYTCTDAEGNVLTLEEKFFGTLYLGVMDVGARITRTINLPEGTVKVEFGECRIVYWSQWA